MEMKKLVIKLEVHDHVKGKRKAMKTVSSFPGIDSITMDTENKLTLLGSVDPIKVVVKLRKLGYAEIVTVGAPDKPKEVEVVNNPEEKKAGEDNKTKEEKQIAELVQAYQNYNPAFTKYYHVYSLEENPNSCVIS